MKPSGPELLFAGRFLITVSISVLVMGLLRLFLFLSGSVLESCTFLRICPFLPSCPFYWNIVTDSSLMILCVSVLSVVISSFSFLILLIWSFSLFLLMNLMVCLFYLLKEPDFSFVDLFCSPFVSLSFISALIFIIYFLLLTLGFFISSYSYICIYALFIYNE